MYAQQESQNFDRVHPVYIQLTSPVRARLRRFFNRAEFAGMRSSEIVTILLDREEGHPDNAHSYAVKKRKIDESPVAPSMQTSVYYQTSMSPPPPTNVVHFEEVVGDEDVGDEFIDEGEESDEYVDESMVGENHGRYDFRSNLGARLDYYSTHDKIVAAKRGDDLDGRGKPGKLRNDRSQGRIAGVGQRQWTALLRRHWYEMIVKWHRCGLLHCRECNVCMNVVGRGVGLRAGHAFDHVCKHLGKPLFVCRICQQQTVTSLEIRDHIRLAHQADTRTFIDFIDTYQQELEQMLAYCFDWTGVTSPITADRPVMSPKKKRGEVSVTRKFDADEAIHSSATARQYCFQMIVKWQRNNALYCRECDQWLRVAAKSNWLRSETAMQHICGHLGKPLYNCRLCPQSTATSRQIRQHLQTIHKSGTRDNYVDATASCEAELRQMAALCFDWSDGGGPPAAEGRRFLRPSLRSGLQNNQARREALSHCRRLVQEFAINTRMTCQVCNTKFVVTTANGYPLAEAVYNHALKHLAQAPYACRLCPKRAANSANIRTHIWSKHKGADLTEFVDYTADAHPQIMSMFAQCYGELPVEKADVTDS